MIAGILSVLLAATGQPGDTVTVYGIGNVSCATAFKPENSFVTNAWILGFWSAWNLAEIKDVAKGTDSNGLIAEVRLSCEAKPSQDLASAIMIARQRLKK